MVQLRTGVKRMHLLSPRRIMGVVDYQLHHVVPYAEIKYCHRRFYLMKDTTVTITTILQVWTFSVAFVGVATGGNDDDF